MWIIPPATADQQRRDIEEMRKKQWAEHEAKVKAKDDWLKAHTCPHCGQHPPLPPWFVGL